MGSKRFSHDRRSLSNEHSYPSSNPAPKASLLVPLPKPLDVPPPPLAAQDSLGLADAPGGVPPYRRRLMQVPLLWILGVSVALIVHGLAAGQAFQYLFAQCQHDSSALPWQTLAILSSLGIKIDDSYRQGLSSSKGRKEENEQTTGEKENSGAKSSSAPEIFLYRVIGNNMPPLQCPSQLLWNTMYALDLEGPLPGCRKRWIINKIVNGTERGLVVDALLAAGYTMDDILIRWFDPLEVAKESREKWLDEVTQQNEARNMAIEDGVRSGARWILPFDGNHFMTKESWGTIRRSARKAEARGLKYFKVPVHRLYKEQEPGWLNSDSKFEKLIRNAPMRIESQLAFRYDAPERFQQGMVYGVQNKLEALSRICDSKSPQGEGPEGEGVGRCWCGDMGKEGQTHPSNVTLARDCGYSLRLWFYPCPGTDATKVFKDGMYRKQLRKESRKRMHAWVKKEVDAAVKQSKGQLS